MKTWKVIIITVISTLIVEYGIVWLMVMNGAYNAFRQGY